MMEGFGFTIVEKLEKLGDDIQKEELKYHQKRVLISKEFTFDAAHHLHAYEGKCKNLHGHTYRVVFGISGFTDDIGLVLDFGDIKKLWKEKIEVKLDHRYLNEMLPAMNTTAENIVVWVYQQMDFALKDLDNRSLRVEYVKLYETPSSFAEARREWMEDV
ncbi:6-carboxytetrahydropterin synthase QueD [Sediminibacillus halophilus]|uniref:6-carboxy-5,6,7,8-tetrahydropterin synthase n=1 Tax=Sediminibacillus halophilus TaxID=482461 RepID=A0A1G9P3E9_9BACI|nr:6-carboxytetrahydropterin synthase QueD [Sediminibacillus halophilus]SDL93224.1 6-pyruvoyltetrahydropterin/6-carboxytetrahydropterin synthase [Sediminibacillus halophilus]